MTQVRRFEDLEIWRSARRMTTRVYRMTAQGKLQRERSLADQMRRAAISVMANIAEGFERDGNSEFRHFLYIAKASSGELRSHLVIAHDLGCMTDENFSLLKEQAIVLSKRITALINSLNRSGFKGKKFARREEPNTNL